LLYDLWCVIGVETIELMEENFVGPPSVGQDCVDDHFVVGELTKFESLGVKEAHN
jgi:hypothetical protein